MYRFVIVDDEPHAIEGIKSYMENLPMFKLVNTYTDPIVALRELRNSHAVDLVFMDVDMPGISGIELAGLIRNKTDKLIIATAHTKYGYDAFEIKADGYLLKPYSLAKFLNVLHQLFPKEVGEVPNTVSGHDLSNFFFVKSKEDNLKLVKVKLENLVAVESKLNYVQLHLSDKRSITTYMSLSEISKILDESRGFIQFQRSFILNKEKIDSIDGNTITMESGKKVTVGEYYKKDFNDFVWRLLLKSRRKERKP